MAYLTVAQLKTYLGIQSSSDDSLLADIVHEAQHVVDDYCNRTFEAAADTTRYYNALDIRYGGRVDAFQNTLLLDVDLCQLTTVVNGNGDTIPSNALVLLPTNFIPSYAIKIKMNTAYVWTYIGTPDTAIVITGRFAYSITCPVPIRAATRRLAGYMYRAKDNTAETDRSIMSADGVSIAAPAIPTDVTRMLEPYRRQS